MVVQNSINAITPIAVAKGGTGATDNTFNTLTSATALPWTGMKVGTDGEIPTFDAAGNPAFVAVGTATHVLTSNGAGAAPTFQAAAGGGAKIAWLLPGVGYIAGTGVTLANNLPGGGGVYISYADGYDNQTWAGTVQVPAGATGITSIQVVCNNNSSGNVYIRFRTSHITADADGTGTEYDETGDYRAIAGSGTNELLRMSLAANEFNGLTGIAEGDLIGINIDRQGEQASDTWAASFLMYGVKFIFS